VEEIKVLFICIHNSARSPMAEAFLNSLGEDKFFAESAGLEPGKLNPLVVDVMMEAGIDISGYKTKSISDFYNESRKYEYVITVCDEISGERCPVFPGKSQRLHWDFEDPSALRGTDEEKTEKIRTIRDNIKQKIIEFINLHK
jgi:arsenate reductase (thioredoxin)